MDKELIINSVDSKVEMALLEGGKLMEIQSQSLEENLQVGDIFLGRVKKLRPSLNAAFIDIGLRQDAFLHYTDLGAQLKSLMKFTKRGQKGASQSASLNNFELEDDIIKTGKINQVLQKKDWILVQVSKEPIGTKGPRLTSDITLPGRYIVLSPFNQHVAVSKKIPSAEERKRLMHLIESIRPKHFGVIVRTAATNKLVADLHEEISNLTGKWRDLHKQLKNNFQPGKLISEMDKTLSFLRDVLNDDFSRIVVNDANTYRNISSFLSNIAENKKKMVHHYRGKFPIFEKYGITKQIKSSFGTTSTMSSGAYLVIEHTEAMSVIDVNSGPRMQTKDQESAAITVNLEAAKEISRQLRLRDIGGLIIIDFIDMRKQENKVLLYKSMRQYMSGDRAQHTILPLSKFGLMQITRQRTKPVVKIDTSEQCPNCNGTGKSTSSILIMDNLQQDLERIIEANPKIKIKLVVHPYLKAYITKGFPSIRINWLSKYQKWINVQSSIECDLLNYQFFNAKNDEIRVNNIVDDTKTI